MANPAIVVDFVANTKDLAAGFRTAQGHASGFGDKLKGIGKAGLVAAGTAGLAALTATLKTGVAEFSEASKVGAQTAAVLKSTGGAAGVTAKQVGALAGSLMRKSGVDDEAIQSGENLLLTFTKVQNQAGKGNDVFTQATRTMLDMSVALGTDAKTSALQLGKALNDPIKGISALSRVGVSFTAAQKEQIKALVAAGDTMGAQKVILRELNKEFGGSAAAAGKTLPGQLNILKESFSNMAGELVGQLVPAFTKVMGVFTAVLGALGKYKGVLPTVVIVLGALAAAVFAVNAALSVYAAIQITVSAATKAWAAAQWLLNAAMAANPFVLVALAVAALVAAFVIAYKTSDTFRAIVDAAFGAVLGIAQTVFGWLKANWPLLLGILTGPVGAAVVMIVRNWDTIKGATSAAWSFVKNATTGTWTAVRNFIAGALSAIASLVSGAWSAVRNATASAWNAVDGAVDRVVASVKSALSGLASWVSGWASGTFAAIVGRIGSMFARVAEGAQGAVHDVQSAINGLVGWLEGIAGKVGAAASSIANAIKRPINAVLSAWNSVSLTIPKISIPKIKVGKKTFGGGGFGGQTIGFPNVPLLAQGAVVDVPTLAMVGEGAGREIVAPESLLRQIMGEQQPAVAVRVFIGDQELTSLVRTEIVAAHTGLARALLAG